MRCATRRGCSMKLVVESITPGIRILSSGISIPLRSSHSWSWRGLAASMLIACGRRVERLDVACCNFPELVVGQVAVLVVAARAEVGAVDLQHEPGVDDGAVL